jgi:hypothetical protein
MPGGQRHSAARHPALMYPLKPLFSRLGDPIFSVNFTGP